MTSIKQLVLFILLGISVNSIGQGCVAIRANSSCGGSFGNTINLNKGEFNAQLGFRHFKSFRHFRGAVEEHERLEAGTEVINNSTFLDLSLNYGISNRFYANAVLPFVYNSRSSMYEHGGNPPNGLGDRHETTSKGISDIRLGIEYWLFDPNEYDFNYSVGIGVKFATGKYDYKDIFYNQGKEKNEELLQVVDQSIQLGDGGTGITLDILGYHPISPNLGIGTSFYYLFNNKESNGVFTRNGQSEFSCPDQFAFRVGVFYNTLKNFNFYIGGRTEGVPSKDIFGSSAGYRRPGYVISAEPGIGYIKNNYSVFVSLPISLYRNRTQSFEDKEITRISGTYKHGDAAFADYLINVGVSYRFGVNHNQMHVMSPKLKDAAI